MKRSLWALMIAFSPACGIDDLPLETRDEAADRAEQPALITDARLEPDQSWEKDLAGRDISWRYISFRQLESSISVIGIFEITFVNTNIDWDVSAEVLVRLIGTDGFRHLPQTPFNQVHIAAGDTILVSENFILEVKDIATANNIARLHITIF